MLVIAAQGTLCPKYDRPNEYITDCIPVKIDVNSYYRRRLSEGSLKEYSEPVVAEQSAKNDITNKKGPRK